MSEEDKKLLYWWQSLDELWKKSVSVSVDDPPTLNQLKKAYMIDTLEFKDAKLTDLSPLKGFRKLENLFCYDSQIESLQGLESQPNLRRLY